MLFLNAYADSHAKSSFPAPKGDVVLSVIGEIEHSNQNGTAVFDVGLLDALAQHTIRTETPWTDGVVTFSGPLLRSVLDRVGARGRKIEAAAINDYKVNIPVADAMELDVIIATRMNGQKLRVRTKGPLWIIYPWETNPELRTERYYSRSIWQLKTIQILP